MHQLFWIKWGLRSQKSREPLLLYILGLQLGHISGNKWAPVSSLNIVLVKTKPLHQFIEYVCCTYTVKTWAKNSKCSKNAKQRKYLIDKSTCVWNNKISVGLGCLPFTFLTWSLWETITRYWGTNDFEGYVIRTGWLRKQRDDTIKLIEGAWPSMYHHQRHSTGSLGQVLRFHMNIVNINTFCYRGQHNTEHKLNQLWSIKCEKYKHLLEKNLVFKGIIHPKINKSNWLQLIN